MIGSHICEHCKSTTSNVEKVIPGTCDTEMVEVWYPTMNGEECHICHINRDYYFQDGLEALNGVENDYNSLDL
jgi:hypothetical protein